MQAFSKDGLYASSLYGMQAPPLGMADATAYQYLYPSSFPSPSTRPSWSPNWATWPDASMYNRIHAKATSLYDRHLSAVSSSSFSDARDIPRSTSSLLAGAITPYPESAQRTVLPDPTRVPSYTTYHDSVHPVQASPRSSSHHNLNSPVLHTAGQHSTAATASSIRRSVPSISQNPSSTSTEMSTVSAGRTYADSHATATNSSAATTDVRRRAQRIFRADPFSSTASEVESAAASAPVALKHEEASGLSPRVLAFSSTLEPLEDAEDPFPLRLEDLASQEEELYCSLSHLFYVDPVGAQNSRQGASGDDSTFSYPTPWSAVKALSISPSVSPMLSPTSSPSVLSELSDASPESGPACTTASIGSLPCPPVLSEPSNAGSEMSPAYTMAPIRSPLHRAPSGVNMKRKSKMHPCGKCGKLFPRPSGLATHMNSHSGEKPFKCPLISCPKKFTVRSNAKRHMRTHGIHLPSSCRLSQHGVDTGTISFEAPVVLDVQYAPDMRPGGKLWEVKWMEKSVTRTAPAGEQPGSEVARGKRQKFPGPALDGALWDPK